MGVEEGRVVPAQPVWGRPQCSAGIGSLGFLGGEHEGSGSGQWPIGAVALWVI